MDETMLHDMVAAALRGGADAAEAVGAERRSLSVASRDGELEEVEREEARDVSLRVFVGRRQAVVGGSDLSGAARSRLVERCLAMARLAPEDPWAGLAPEARLARGPAPDLDLHDPAEPSAEALEAAAAAADAAARADPAVTNTDGGQASSSHTTWRLVTSGGFSGAHRTSAFSLSASAIAGEGSGMERGGEGRTTRHLADLPAPAAVGAEAARRAAERLGPRKIDSCTAAVIFENRVAGSLLSPLMGAIAGPAVARGVSFLKDKLGERLFGPDVTLVDEPRRPRGLGSTAFDDEGVTAERCEIVARGVLTTWILNCASAAQLGLATTGHASRGGAGAPGVGAHNPTLLAGAEAPAKMMKTVGAGLLVTNMFGPALNANTGDWSAGVSGLWFENGEVAYPVAEITVAGNLLDIYAKMIPLSDLEIRGASNTPSLFVDALTVAGR